jgi:hypothetical protein
MSHTTFRRAARVAVPAALAALTITSTAQASLFDQSRVVDPTTEGVHRGLSLQMYGSRIDSLATAQRLARSHAIISMVPGQLNGFGDEMKQANPKLRLFAYVNGMFAQKSQGTTFPASWYMPASNGGKIRSRGWGNYLMDPRARATYRAGNATYGSWGDYVAGRCKAIIAQSQGAFDGCFLDMLGTAPLSAGYNVGGAVPVKSRGGARWTAAEWFSQLSGPVAAKVEQVSGAPAYANGIGSGTRFYGGAGGPSRVLYQYATAGDAEVWLRGPGTPASAFPTLDKWKTEVRMLADASAAGGVVNATVKIWTGATAAQKEQWRRYSYGSFLLGNTGHATFEFTAARTVRDATADSPLYSLALGAPSETGTVDSYARGGVYQRAFANGLVLVNPGTKAVTVSLDGAHKTAAGQTVTQVSVPAHDAAILTR